MAGEQVPWPTPPREPGPWNGGPPVSPPGNTPLPPLPGAGGVVHGATPQANPWAQQAPPQAQPSGWANPNVPQVNIPPERRADQFPGLPPAGNVLVDRAPLPVLVLSAVVVLALIAGAVYFVLNGGREYPSAWDERAQPIAAWVAKERELEFDHPVTVNFLSEKEYRARATEGGDDDSEESKQYYEDQAAQLRALGFLSGEVDLSKASDTLSDSGTLAYYDPDLEQVFVRGTKMTPALKVTLAHELTHVLQDQNFDLGRLDEFDDGRGAVLRALGEGDATKVEEAYVDEVLTDDEKTEYMKESQEGSDEANESLEKDVPPILSTIFASPYILGPQLIELLFQEEGWEGIDAALEEPPTEEVMFDPMTYKSDAAGHRTVEIDAPEGTEELESDEFGPTTWYLLLASRIDPNMALAATDGWGGDRYVVYRQDDKVCLDANIVTDTEGDLTQMQNALGAWAAKTPKTAKVTAEGDTIKFHSCDPGKDAKQAGGNVTPDLLTVPVVRTQVYAQGLDADRTPKEATCYANGVVNRFTYSQLIDPEGAFIGSNEGQAVLEELRSECFS